MKLFVVCILFVLYFALSDGAAAHFSADPDHPGKCYTKLTGEMSYDEVKPLKDCQQATCNNDGTIQLVTCGKLGLTPNCHIERNESADYPDCCGKVICN